MRRGAVPGWLVSAAAVWLALPSAAAACSVCFGAADDPMTEGMNFAILTLLAFVVVIYGGVIKLFWELRKRRRDLDRAVPELRLIHGGKR